MAELEGVVYPFEDTGDAPLALLPLAARRALDSAGFRLPLEGYQSLPLDDRKALALAGSHDVVDAALVERLVKRSTMPATRIKPVLDPDRDAPPEQLSAALGARRTVDAATWLKLRALDRYALVHVLRRSIAHDDPARLEAAVAAILPPKAARGGRSDLPPDRRPLPDVEIGEAEVSLPSVLLGPPRAPEANMEGQVTAPPPQGYPFRPPSRPPASEARGSKPPATMDYRHRPPSAPPPRSDAEPRLSSHLNADGDVHMVGVAHKEPSLRRATACARVYMAPDTARRVLRHDVPKGEVLATARVAGIMAAKSTPQIVPLCHPIALTKVEVLIDVEESSGEVTVTTVVEAFDRTGVEMEALSAASAACLTVYDMLKGIDPDMVIGDLRVLTKSGGKTGDYRAPQHGRGGT